MKRIAFFLSFAALFALAFVPEVSHFVQHIGTFGQSLAMMSVMGFGAVLAPSLERLYDGVKDVDPDGTGNLSINKAKLMETLDSASAEIARLTGGNTTGGLRFVQTDGGITTEEYIKRTERNMADPTAFSHHLRMMQIAEPRRYDALRMSIKAAVKEVNSAEIGRAS